MLLRALAVLTLILLRPAAAPAQTPTAPAPDSNTAVSEMNRQYIRIWRTLMTPKNVADAFGSRIAKRYIAMQITVANRNKDYQWLIQDASIDLSSFLEEQKARKGECKDSSSLFLLAGAELADSKVASADLTVLRGVAEKGQALDTRNIALRSLTGAGVVAAGLIGIARVGRSFAPAVAVFNGPFLDAFKGVFPDYTIEQMNRLNDSAFLANTIVGKQQAKVLVMFIPQPYLLSKKQQKMYYSEPESIYNCVDLRLLDANVNGNFITGVNLSAAPTPTAADPVDQKTGTK